MLIGFFGPRALGPVFVAETDLYISQPSQTVPESFSYDGFYSQQTSKDVTDSLMGFFKSKQVANSSLDGVGSYQSISNLIGGTSAKKLSTNILRVSSKARTPIEAENNLNSMTKSAVATFNKVSANKGITITSLGTKPVVYQRTVSPFLTGFVGFFLGCTLIGGFFLLKENYT